MGFRARFGQARSSAPRSLATVASHRWRGFVVAALAAVCLSSCVVTQSSSGAVQTPEDPVVFKGFSRLPRQRVELRVRNARGRLETFARTRTQKEARVLDDGSRLYPWEIEAVVPHWKGDDCERTAEVRAVARIGRRATPLFTYDEDGAECLHDALEAGKKFDRALASCARSLRTKINLHAATSTHDGDVEIFTQADADALHCVTRIDGNLTIRPTADDGQWPNLSGTTTEVTLPNLQEVTGDLFIEVQTSGVGHGTPAELARLPALHSLGGNLRFHHIGQSGYVDIYVELLLPALMHLDGDVEIEVGSFEGELNGLNALESVGGDLRYQGVGDQILDNAFLSLTRIDGNLAIDTPSSFYNTAIMESLVEVGGDVDLWEFERPLKVLSSLREVGGDFRMLGTRWGYVAEPLLPALARVHGSLAVVNDAADLSLGAVLLGSPDLSMGALELRNTLLDHVPLPPGARVDVSGPITISHNELLCQVRVDAFLDVQRAAGWMGPEDVQSNDGSCGL